MAGLPLKGDPVRIGINALVIQTKGYPNDCWLLMAINNHITIEKKNILVISKQISKWQ